MSRPPGEPLTRITIWLYTDDVDALKAAHPSGYQVKIKELVRAYCQYIPRKEDANG